MHTIWAIKPFARLRLPNIHNVEESSAHFWALNILVGAHFAAII